MMPALRRRAWWIGLCYISVAGSAQTFVFELRSIPESPVAFINDSFLPWRAGADLRRFVTIQNRSDKALIGVTFQQAISTGARTEIVTLERISMVMAPREKRRVSVSVTDVLNRLKTAGSSEKPPSPVLTVVAVEYSDGSAWVAP